MKEEEQGKWREVDSEETLENPFLTARFLHKETLTSSPMHEGRSPSGRGDRPLGSSHKADQAASEGSCWWTEAQTTVQGEEEEKRRGRN